MCCYAGKLLQQPAMKNPTLVVVTDRNELDGQLYQQFCMARDLLKQTPEQANSREELREMLAVRESGGIIFTTVQKFSLLDDEDAHPLLCDRSNVVVISDEAHRSTIRTLLQSLLFSKPVERATRIVPVTNQAGVQKAVWQPAKAPISTKNTKVIVRDFGVVRSTITVRYDR